MFDEGMFKGAVTSFDSASQLYHVRYTDGDEEDINGDELAAHLGHGSVEGELYKVEKILAHKTTETQKLLFQVKWEGWPKPTWEPEENLHPRTAEAYISASSSSSANDGFVEQILRHRTVKGNLEFNVLWQGSNATTWEPENNLHPQIVQNYFNTTPSSSENGGLHIVEKILSHKTTKDKKLLFHVLWQGWPQPTWEPEANLTSELVQTYLSAGAGPDTSARAGKRRRSTGEAHGVLAVSEADNGTSNPREKPLGYWAAATAQLNYDTEELIFVHASMTLAARHVGAKSACNISACCRGERTSSHGYKWRRATFAEAQSISKPAKKKKRQQKMAVGRGGKEKKGQLAVGRVVKKNPPGAGACRGVVRRDNGHGKEVDEKELLSIPCEEDPEASGSVAKKSLSSSAKCVHSEGMFCHYCGLDVVKRVLRDCGNDSIVARAILGYALEHVVVEGYPV
jgi:hypothetical protein